MPSLEAQATVRFPNNNVFSYKATEEANLASETSASVIYSNRQRIALHSICSQFSILSHLSEIALHSICCYSSIHLKKYAAALHSLCVYSPLFMREYKAALHNICVSLPFFVRGYKIALHGLCVYSPIYEGNYKIALHSLCFFQPALDFTYKNALHFLLTCEAKTSTFLVLTTLLCVPKGYVPTIFTFTLPLPIINRLFTTALRQYHINLNLYAQQAFPSLTTSVNLNLPAASKILFYSQSSIPLLLSQIYTYETILSCCLASSLRAHLSVGNYFSLLLPFSMYYFPLRSASYKKFLLHLFYFQQERLAEAEWYLCPFRFVSSLQFLTTALSFSLAHEFGLSFSTMLLFLRFPSITGYYLYFSEELMRPYFKYHKIYTIDWP